MILALAGGVGGAKLANGLAQIVPPGELTIVVNTGDDFDHLGLRICPDIDTVTYTLAGINNRTLGWGQQDESWAFMDALRKLGGEDWFALGDRDLATHIRRTQRLAAGDALSTITADFAASLGIAQRIVPMTDDRVASIVETDAGALAFQDYFVRMRCEPRFEAIRFDGIATARAHVEFVAALDDPGLEAIIFCPSNPLLSISPILNLPGITDRLRARRVPCVAVSPFIGGKAVKGPAAKIMVELGQEPNTGTIARYYNGLIDGLVIDHADAAEADFQVETLATDSLMRNEADQSRLAGETLDFARSLKRASA